ncbi:hypothetical protein KJ359_002724 [Pestalotiopsis sp. 9143b]|nr:hypothetical protein KJ359_002724 [Pestalotiopsis sp. 9143b]
MTWFPVVVYRWVQDSIRRVPAAILTRLGILDAPSDDGQEILVQTTEDEEQQSPRQGQPQIYVNAWPPYRSYRGSYYRSSMYAHPDYRVQNERPSSQPTNGPQQATEAAGAADAAGSGYSGNDAGQVQTGYRTPDPDSGYDSLN